MPFAPSNPFFAMPHLPDLNDLYQDWLEIPARRLPPNHYALLGIDDFESDEEVIEAAAKTRSAYLHQIASGPQRKIVQEMLGQVAIARRTLMSVEAREEYDQSLREVPQDSEAASAGSAGVAGSNDVPGSNATETGAAEGVRRTPGGVHRSAVKSEPVGSSQRSSGSKQTGDWRVHAISAGVLLVVAVVFYF